MKEQTFITFTYDENGKQINFERWTYKTVKSVKKALFALFYGRYALTYGYLERKQGASYFEIYATPDGYHVENENFIEKITLDELQKIGA